MKHYKGRPGGCTTRRRKSINKRMAADRAKYQTRMMNIDLYAQHDEAICRGK